MQLWKNSIRIGEVINNHFTNSDSNANIQHYTSRTYCVTCNAVEKIQRLNVKAIRKEEDVRRIEKRNRKTE